MDDIHIRYEIVFLYYDTIEYRDDNESNDIFERRFEDDREISMYMI